MGAGCVVSQKDIDSCFEVHKRHKTKQKTKVNHWRLKVTLKVEPVRSYGISMKTYLKNL